MFKPLIPAFFVNFIISAWIYGPFLLNSHQPCLQPIASPTAASNIDALKRLIISYELLYGPIPIFRTYIKEILEFGDILTRNQLNHDMINSYPKQSQQNIIKRSRIRNDDIIRNGKLDFDINYDYHLQRSQTQTSQSMSSFMNWLFGKEDKKPEVAAPPVKKTEEDKKVIIEAQINFFEGKIKDFEDRERKLEMKVQLYRTKAKELIAAGRQKEAKKYAHTATSNQKQLDSYSLRKNLLVNKKYQLEEALMNLETISALGNAALSSRQQEELAEILEGLIIDANNAKLTQQQIEGQLRTMVGNGSDDEETNDMFDELLKEAKNDKLKKIEIKKEKAQTLKEVDEIDKMLANL